jgi:carboxyl-terminal processing protease
MKFRAISLVVLLAFLTSGVSFATATNSLQPLPEHSFSAQIITQLIERFHYKKTRLDNEQSEEILEQYLKSLDPNRSFFTQEDIDSFGRYATTLDDALARGDLEPTFAIFRIYKQRRMERAKFALDHLKLPFNFDKNETYRFDRSEAPWAHNQEALDEIWRKRVKNDVLALLLTNKTDKESRKILSKRYERIITRSNQFKPEDAYEVFINTYLSTVGPHTGYFSPRSSENFNINMSLSLEGIGAALQTVDEHTVVQRIITGGPADLDGRLKTKDKIVSVAQGHDGEFEDVVGWRIDDVVSLIRGPKDSVVRLQVLPKESGVDGPSKIITIMRNKVKLEEQQAKKKIIEIPSGTIKKRIGVITIPTFYMDFQAHSRGEEDYRSTTRDTRRLVDELIEEKVDGIIVDLRDNGGGSLSEAVSLTGLFIKDGPVVQIRGNDGKTKSNNDTDPGIVYTGPLAVLVNRFSASASEIFAGAIQDYGRGTIVGEPTFGKGTVQSVIDLNRYTQGNDVTLGRLKLTVAQFFRVNGDSTQHRGVIPDIVFPTAEDNANHGERALKNALAWASIKASDYKPFNRPIETIDDIKARHEQRIKSDSGFKYLLAQAEVRRSASDKKEVSLLRKNRKLEREALETEQNELLNRFRLSRGMKSVHKTSLIDNEDNDNEADDDITEEIELIEVRETASILVDLIAKRAERFTQQVDRQALNKL